MLGVSPSYVRKLADQGILPFRKTKGGHRVFDPRATMEAYARRAEGPTIHLDLPLDGLEEDAVWSQLEKQSPAHRATDQARKVARYAFTELLNNAIDPS